MPIVQGGRASYGQAIGILLLDSQSPRMPGDNGNATTFNFPVRLRVVRGASPTGVVMRQDPALLGPFIEAARELEAEGVRAISTSCGFLALFQREMAAAVNIPVFTSSLMQAPVVYRMLRPDQKIGILTAHADYLTHRVLEAVGAADVPSVVVGSENTPAFYNVFVLNSRAMDPAEVERGVVQMATDMVRRHPEVGAFVCEGTSYSTWGPAIQEATGLPFFDIVTLTRWVYEAVVRRRDAGGFM